MALYDKVLQDIVAKQKLKEKGNHNVVPFPFPGYHDYFEGWNKGEYIGLMGSTGSGKSRFTRYCIYEALDFAMQENYPLKIIYFALEDPEIPVGKKIMAHYLYTRQGIIINPKALNSTRKVLHKDIVGAIQRDEAFYRKIDSMLHVINHISSPNGINGAVQKAYEKYGETHHLWVIIDNQSNLTKDQEDAGEWEAIKRFSRDIVRLKWCSQGITTLKILQQDFDQEKHTFRNVGKGSLVSIEPNLSSIGDAKVVAKNFHYCFALFDPHRFDIKEYPFSGGYSVEILKNRFKVLLHLKSNEGEIAPRLPMLFNGAQEIFTQLPSLDNKEELNRIYNQIIQEEKEKIQKRTLFT